MNKLIIRAIAIAIPYTAAVTILAFSFTLQYVAIAEPSSQTVYRGLEAVKYIITSEGWLGYAYGMSRHFAFLFIVVLFALLIQGYVYYRDRNA